MGVLSFVFDVLGDTWLHPYKWLYPCPLVLNDVVNGQISVLLFYGAHLRPLSRDNFRLFSHFILILMHRQLNYTRILIVLILINM